MIKKNEVIRVGPNPKGTAALLEDRYKQVLCLLALMSCAQMSCAGRPALDIAPGLELLSTHNLDFILLCVLVYVHGFMCVLYTYECASTLLEGRRCQVSSSITSCLIPLK